MGKLILLVGAGGFVGSVARFLSQQAIARIYPSSFPWGTMLVNIAGCFIIGLVYGLGEKGNILSPEMRLLLATGFCGGFTTFSSFAYDNVGLLRDGELLYAFLYIAVSVLIGLLAAYLGVLIVKSY
jgi:CrcB protein